VYIEAAAAYAIRRKNPPKINACMILMGRRPNVSFIGDVDLSAYRKRWFIIIEYGNLYENEPKETS